MGIEIAIAAACASEASAYSSKAAHNMGSTHEDPILAKRREAPPAPVASAKCPCCGSRQFKVHASRRICTYCRSEQDGEVVELVPSDAYRAFYQNGLSAMHSERLDFKRKYGLWPIGG